MSKIHKNGMPIGAPLVCPAPYLFKDSEFHIFILETDIQEISEWIPETVTLAKPATIWLVIAHHHNVTAKDYPELKLGFNKDIFILTPVLTPVRDALCILACYSNSDITVATGREIYGMPYKLGKITINKKKKEDLFECKLVRRNIDLITLKALVNTEKVEETKKLKNLLGQYSDSTSMETAGQYPAQVLKLLNHKYIPSTKKRIAQSNEITLVKPTVHIDHIRSYINDPVEITFNKTDEESLNCFGKIKQVIANFHAKCALNLPYGKTIMD